LDVVFELIGGLENNPPTPHMHAPRMGQNPDPCTPEEDREEDEGRRVLSEALEEDAPLTPSAFQTAQIIRFSNRRPQSTSGIIANTRN
jgi:hypothetical protein